MARQGISKEPNISADGSGLRIKLWKKGKLFHSETLPGDASSKTLLAQAITRRDWLKHRMALGLPLNEGEAGSEVFKDVAQDFLNQYDAKTSTHLTCTNRLNYYWMPVFGHWPIKDITSRAIKDVMATHPITNKTKQNAVSDLRAVLDYGDVNPNPCNTVKYRRKKAKKKGNGPSSYTPAQRDKLMAALDKMVFPPWLHDQPPAYFALLFGCGLRPCGEPLALQWSDYSGDTLHISKQMTGRRLQHYTKTDEPRTVDVPTWVQQYLDKLPSRFRGEYLFQNSRGGPYRDTDHMNDAWRKAHAKARIPYQVPYACRHTRASELLSLGAPSRWAADQLGHSIAMFETTYAELIAEFAPKQDMSMFSEGKAPVRECLS